MKPSIAFLLATAPYYSFLSANVNPLNLLPFTVEDGQLIVQSPIVINVTDEKQTTGEKVDDSREPLAHIKPVNPENPEKGEQNPGHVIIVSTCSESEVGLAIHRGDQKEIHDPTDEKQS
jgi:hypothetical protein